MRFGILGPTEARPDGDRPVPVGGPGLRALLGLLLLNAGRVVTIDRLIDGLYGAEPPSGADNALQAQVSRLRRHLASLGDLGDLVVREPAGYRLAVDPDDVDASRFERLAAEGRRALDAGDPARAAGLLGQALALWRGPALADVPDAPFAPAQAARLEELRLSAAEDLAEAGLALGRHRDLLPELQERIAAHPLRERSRGQLMRALYAAGRPAEALAAYDDTRRVLADELGADPSAELSAIHLAVLRSDPALTPASAAPGGRPVPLTSLVGRAAELERIEALLAEARLVTLTGPGGTGKTRLALEAATRWPGEVCLVELAPLTDGADVPQAVLGALGLRETAVTIPTPGTRQTTADPVTRLVAALTLRPVLLVLDNCEHVVEEAARLADRLLAACPALRVLATGREALGITGERLCPVPPLRVPPPGDELAVEDALAYPAVGLFVERAAAVRPGFALAPGDVEHVLRICRALDGLPLAVELAAARLRSLPLARIAARLGSDDGDPVAEGDAPRFALLSRGSRTAQPRHRTLRAVVEWSWDLLDEPERALARRLTIFAGGATLEAAERVCGLPDTDGVLASLVDKSLVEVVDDRYRMLETIRAFCAERLAEAGESEPMRKAHLAYVLDLVTTADPHLRGPDQIEWLRRLDGERDDLQAALRRAVRAGDVAPALRMLSAMSGYWILRGLRGEAARSAAELLGRIGSAPPEGLEEEYIVCACLVGWGGMSGPGLDTRVAEAARRTYTLPMPPRQPFLLVLHALINGPPPREEFHDLGGLFDALNRDPWTRTLSRFSLSYLKMFDGRLAEAEQELAEALREARSIGDLWVLVIILSAVADVADRRGDHEQVEALVNEALELAERLGATSDVAETLCRRAWARMRSGRVDAAKDDYDRAAALSRRTGAPEVLAAALLGLGELARLDGDMAGARRRYEAALAECTTAWFNVEETRSRIYLALGWAAQNSESAAEALAWHRRALTTVPGTRRSFGMTAAVAEGVAGVALLEGDPGRSAWLLGVGAALRGAPAAGDPDVARVEGRSRAALGGEAFDRAYGQGRAYARERMAITADTDGAALTIVEGHLSALGG
ncbi:BTAD domain-containing putative transcriptional regulator [Microbispora catharanthi]|uniref:AAA family ATPase n=1 Tax=Microbispora catharanthi TaxID=1712871 RepID=A0A5N6BSJ8_9ACTN|nr:BTAD domain-containing putative transcriptional regulator [Microbispora catharanthi]KAB8183444.1 AAA family ATPase [Microbispora catharanthi]